MKVLMLNGSPHPKGCTFTALSTVAAQLEKNGVETQMLQLGTKPMLLQFTADWCPNCKFMEATVLTDERLRRLQARYNMELVRVDLTNANAYAVRLLEALGSKSIPLTALFPAGDMATAPLVLRDVYGSDSLEQSMRDAFGR